MERISRAKAPPTDAPIATAMVESLGGGTEERAGEERVKYFCRQEMERSATLAKSSTGLIKQSGERENVLLS